MSGNILIVISRCAACSGLDKQRFKELTSLVRRNGRAGKILEVDQLCAPEKERRLRTFKAGSCDRAIIASWCSQEAIGKLPLPKGIDPSLVEFVDFSIQTPKNAKERPRFELLASMISMTAVRLALSEPVKERRIKFATRTVAVIGSSEAALRAARGLVQHGVSVTLIISQKLPRVKERNIDVIDEASVEKLTGIPGNFKIFYSQHGLTKETDCAAVLLVAERCLAEVRPPANPRIKFVPLERFGDYLPSGAKPKGIVFLDDLGSLAAASDPSVPAWHLLLESARDAAAANLAECITVILRDVKAAGLLELIWKEAAEAGVKFVRYDNKTRPRIDKSEPMISVKDLVLGENLNIPADVVIAPITTRPLEPMFIERLFVPGDWDFRVRSRGPQRGLGQSSCDGIFVVGYAGYARLTDQAYPELGATIAEIVRFIRQGYHVVREAVAIIDEDKCSACNTCVRTCPYRAPIINDRWKAEIVKEKCTGCGSCVAVCPSRAIELKNCTRQQIASQILSSQEVAF